MINKVRVLLFLSVVFTGTVQAQINIMNDFALVNDPDGYVYVRSSAENKDNISDTLNNGDVVWCFEPQGNWVNIDYQKDGKNNNGYVYYNRLKGLSALDNLAIKILAKDSTVLQLGSILVTLSTQIFDTTKNKLLFDKDNERRSVIRVNNKPFWGTDGEIPRKMYRSILVNWGKRQYSLPKNLINDLFEPSLKSTQAVFDRQKNTLYLSTLNGDAAGAYVVLWILKNGMVRDRIVTIPF